MVPMTPMEIGPAPTVRRGISAIFRNFAGSVAAPASGRAPTPGPVTPGFAGSGGCDGIEGGGQ